MFDLDKWQEIFTSLKKHKLRTFLTGFGVAWGIFILVILLGSGRGLQSGIESNFTGFAKNSIYVYGGMTSKPYKGLSIGRSIKPTLRDLEVLKKTIPEIEYLSPQVNLSVSGMITYQDKEGSYSVQGITADKFEIVGMNTIYGRLLNRRDDELARKVVIIGEQVHEELFNMQDPVGEYLNVGNEFFMVVGVFKPESDQGDMSSVIYMPVQSLMRTYSQSDEVRQFSLIPKSGVSAKIVETKMRDQLAGLCKFDPSDRRALWIRNIEEQFESFQALFSGINIFLWIVGISTLVGGVVGVGNIMLVTVKERTKEIGIRKSLGATPKSIINLILSEAVIITTAAGYAGLLLGILLLQVGGFFVKNMQNTRFTFFADPQIDIKVAISATILLIVAGAFAGFIPARKAARVNPIEALRYE